MDELKKLKDTGKYLFHGSMTGDIKVLEPRQAMSFGKPDGPPAVCADDSISPPIFMALLGSRKLGGWGRKDLPGYGFYVVEDDLQRAKQENWEGYVYVLDKLYFENHLGGHEWRSYKNIEPLKCIKVGISDLPTNIEIMTREEYLSMREKAE